MADQAAALRLLKRVPDSVRSAERIVAVASGKGGVGKSNIALNLAVALTEADKHVIVLDADFGMANICILAGVMPRHTLTHVIRNGVDVNQILLPGPGGITIIPGAGGTSGMADLTAAQRGKLLKSLGEIRARADFLIVDLGAGVAQNVMDLAMRADDLLVVVTPEPTSMADAYGVLKAVAERGTAGRDTKISLIVNRANSIKDAKATADRLTALAMQYLELPVAWGGFVLDDRAVSKSVVARSPFVLSHPRSLAAQSIRLLARRLAGAEDNAAPDPGRTDVSHVQSDGPRRLRRWFERIFA